MQNYKIKDTKSINYIFKIALLSLEDDYEEEEYENKILDIITKISSLF